MSNFDAETTLTDMVGEVAPILECDPRALYLGVAMGITYSLEHPEWWGQFARAWQALDPPPPGALDEVNEFVHTHPVTS